MVDLLLNSVIYWKFGIINFNFNFLYYYLSPTWLELGVSCFRLGEVLYFRLALSYSSYSIYMG